MKQKGFTVKQEAGFIPILIIIGAVVIAAALGGYLVYSNYSQSRTKILTTSPQTTQPSSTPSAASRESTSPAASPVPNGIVETADWKTYNDPRGIFSIKYPQDWYESKNAKWPIRKNDPEPLSLGAVAACQPESQDCYYTGMIVIFELLHKPGSLNLDQFATSDPSLCTPKKFDNYEYNHCFGISKEISRKSISVGGVESISYIESSEPSPHKFEVLIPKSPTEVILIYMSKNRKGSIELDPEYVSILEKMLSTFKFTQ